MELETLFNNDIFFSHVVSFVLGLWAGIFFVLFMGWLENRHKIRNIKTDPALAESLNEIGEYFRKTKSEQEKS